MIKPIRLSSAAKVTYWPERLFALLLAGLLTLTLLTAFSVRTSIIAATDFKTIYASAWNLRHGADAYSFQNVVTVLNANGVTPPPTAYGHNAVYPPFSLALLAPLTFIPLIPATWLWSVAGCIAISAAFAALARAAGDDFGLARGGRFLLIFIAILGPAFSFATLTQNVSLMAAALSLLVISSCDRIWLRSIGLAIALLLKPHVALWPALSLLLLRTKDGRRVVLQAILICVVVVAATGVWMALNHQLASQLASYAAAVRVEIDSGSMNPTRHDVLPAGLQITSLNCLIGYWQSSPAILNGLSWSLLTILAASLLWSTWRINHLPEDALTRAKFVVIAACCSFGLIATYHRAHDALIMVVLLPWLVPRLKPASGTQFRLKPLLLPWSMLAFLLLLAAIIPSNSTDLWKFRQASICAAGLAALLAIQMVSLARTAVND